MSKYLNLKAKKEDCERVIEQCRNFLELIDYRTEIEAGEVVPDSEQMEALEKVWAGDTTPRDEARFELAQAQDRLDSIEAQMGDLEHASRQRRNALFQ